MKEKIIITGSSNKVMESLNEFYFDFKEIKKLTTYLDKVNFLLDEYQIEDTSVDMILENFDGTVIYVSGLNCGYWGEGARTTQNLLMKIGFTEEESHKLVLNEALKIEFKEKGNFKNLKISTDCIFKSKEKYSETEIAFKYLVYKNIKFDIVNRNIYILNPQEGSLIGLLALINLIKVYEVEYYIGEKSKLEKHLRVEELFREYDYKARGVNLIVRGDKFDIICFINIDNQIDVISTIYSEIFKESFFRSFYSESNFILTDKNIGRIRSIFLLLKGLFFNRNPKIVKKILFTRKT